MKRLIVAFLAVCHLAALPAMGQGAMPAVPGEDGPGRRRGRPRGMAWMAGPGGGLFMLGRATPMPVRISGPIAYPYRVNIIDRARFGAADLLVQKNELDEAMAELTAIIEKSPDPTAVSCAHLSRANILSQHKNDPDAALAEYNKACDKLAALAGEGIARIYRESGEPARGAAVLERLVEQAEGAQAVAILLATAARLHLDAGDRQKAVDTLKRGPDLVRDADDRRVPRFMQAEQFRDILADMARLLAAEQDKEAEALMDDLRSPWRRRMREFRARRAQPEAEQRQRGVPTKQQVPPPGEMEIRKKDPPAPE